MLQVLSSLMYSSGCLALAETKDGHGPRSEKWQVSRGCSIWLFDLHLLNLLASSPRASGEMRGETINSAFCFLLATVLLRIS